MIRRTEHGTRWPAVGLMIALATTARADVPPPTTEPVSSADAEDEYTNAVQQLQSADAAVVRAREQAVLAYRATPAYAAAAAALDAAFDAYAAKRDALLMSAEQHDPRFAPLKKGAADVEAELARAGQNASALTPEQFGELLGQRAAFQKQLEALEDDAVDRDATARRLRQQWADASAHLCELQDKQAAAVDGSDQVRAAVVATAAARAGVDRARAAATGVAADSADLTADEFVRRYPRHGLSWNDAWLTYGTTGTVGK